jgi:hypothetical protein
VGPPGLALVEAHNHFCGTICHQSLAKLCFLLVTKVCHVSGSNAKDGELNEQLWDLPQKGRW